MEDFEDIIKINDVIQKNKAESQVRIVYYS